MVIKWEFHPHHLLECLANSLFILIHFIPDKVFFHPSAGFPVFEYIIIKKENCTLYAIKLQLLRSPPSFIIGIHIGIK